jgi:hypothetical protein
MTDVASSAQIILQEAAFETWLVAVDQYTAVCFEDNAVMGFVYVFDEPQALLLRWRSMETALLNRNAPRFREAEEKAWNIYSIFLCAKTASEEETREIRRIDEDLERTRKIAACGLAGHADIVAALLPILPIQHRPQLGSEDLTERLKRRIAAVAPAAVNVALDDKIPPAEVVRLLGAPT